MSGRVLVLGAGLTGLQAAVEIAAADARAILVEQGPILGGKRVAWLKGDNALDPRLADIADNALIEYHTLAQLHSLEGDAGNFTAQVAVQPRYVTDDCTRCNHCVPVCPQAVSNEYDAGLTFRKAIHSPLPETIPDIYVIDINSCLNSPPNYLPCQHCVEVCDDHAIHFNMPVPDLQKIEVDAVVVATGYADNSERERQLLAEFAYGVHPDVLSSVELQRLLEDPGPSGGYAIKPSSEEYPDKVLLVLTRVSANAVWVMCNQLRQLAAQDIEQLDVLVLASNMDDPLLQGLREAVDECRASLHTGAWLNAEAGAGNQLAVRYLELPGGSQREALVDLVVLSSEVEPDQAVAELGDKLGLVVDERGYLTPSRPGIYLAGGVVGTVGIEAGAGQAKAAVEAALQHIGVVPEPSAAVLPEWAELPPQNQRRYLEQMLSSLMKLGEGRKS